MKNRGILLGCVAAIFICVVLFAGNYVLKSSNVPLFNGKGVKNSNAEDILEFETAITLTEEELSKILTGKDREEIVEAWGEPDQSLFGMFGDIYGLEESDKYIILYYDESSLVETVKIGIE